MSVSALSRGQKILIAVLLLWAVATFGTDLLRPWLSLGTFGFKSSNDGVIEEVDPRAALDPPGCIKPEDRIRMLPSFKPQRDMIAIFKNNDGPFNPVIHDHEPLHLQIGRGSSFHACKVSVVQPLVSWILWVPVFLQDLAGVIFIGICARIVWQHPLPATWGLFFYSLWFNSALNFASYAELERWPDFVLVEELLQSIIQAAGYIGLIVFAAQFPEAHLMPGPLRRVYRWSLTLLFCILVLLQLTTFGTAFGVGTEATNELTYWSGVGVDVAFGIILLARYPRMEPTDKQRTRWVLWGCLGLLSYIVADALESTTLLSKAESVFDWHPGPELEVELAFPYMLSVLLPLAVSVAIGRTRVFQVRLLLTRITTFGLVVGIFFCVVLLVEELLAERFKARVEALLASPPWAFGITLIVVSTMTFSAEHLRSIFTRYCKRRFFPRVADFEKRLGDVKHQLASALSADDIGHLLAVTAREQLDIASVAVFRRQSDGTWKRTESIGWGAGTSTGVPVERLPAWLRLKSGPQRLDENSLLHLCVPRGVAQPVLAIPVSAGEDLLAVVLYGAHEKGDDILDDELRMLAELAESAAVGYVRCELHALRHQLRQPSAWDSELRVEISRSP